MKLRCYPDSPSNSLPLRLTVPCSLKTCSSAESLGLGGCYIGAIRNKIGEVDKLLRLPDKVYPVFGMCLGYPAQDPEIKPRLPVEVILKQHHYNNDGDRQLITDYDEQVRRYYRTRTGGTKDNSWSEQISDMLVKEARPHMLPFLQSKGFLLK